MIGEYFNNKLIRKRPILIKKSNTVLDYPVILFECVKYGIIPSYEKIIQILDSILNDDLLKAVSIILDLSRSLEKKVPSRIDLEKSKKYLKTELKTIKIPWIDKV